MMDTLQEPMAELQKYPLAELQMYPIMEESPHFIVLFIILHLFLLYPSDPLQNEPK